MAKILGGKEHGCALCGGTTLKIKICGDIYFQCKECGAMTKAYEEDEIIIYKEEEEVDEKYYLSDDKVKGFKEKIQSELKTNNDKPKLVGGFGEINFGKQYRQGNRVYDGEGIAMCLTAQPLGNLGGYSYLYKINEINQVGMLDIKGNEQVRRVYGDNGTSPTLNTMQGGNRQPKIIELPCIAASRGRNPENPSSRVAGEPTEQRLEFNTKGTSNTLTRVQKDNYVVEQAFRIRKLTPRECFRLMGLHDDDIDKIQATGVSNTQQYKMAGNSIVVDVLEAIFKNLFKEEQ